MNTLKKLIKFILIFIYLYVVLFTNIFYLEFISRESFLFSELFNKEGLIGTCFVIFLDIPIFYILFKKIKAIRKKNILHKTIMNTGISESPEEKILLQDNIEIEEVSEFYYSIPSTVFSILSWIVCIIMAIISIFNLLDTKDKNNLYVIIFFLLVGIIMLQNWIKMLIDKGSQLKIDKYGIFCKEKDKLIEWKDIKYEEYSQYKSSKSIKYHNIVLRELESINISSLTFSQKEFQWLFAVHRARSVDPYYTINPNWKRIIPDSSMAQEIINTRKNFNQIHSLWMWFFEKTFNFLFK